jgi:hypothetical protein
MRLRVIVWCGCGGAFANSHRRHGELSGETKARLLTAYMCRAMSYLEADGALLDRTDFEQPNFRYII